MAGTEKNNLREQVAMLPQSPGVYQFVDRSGTIIYVGKAKSLRKRVSSYFVQSKEHSPKVRVLVKQIAEIRHIVVGSETDALLLEKTPCFIWSADLQPMKVDKTLNTSDLLPTMLNLLGVDSPYDYIGRDAFDPTYEGYALFSDGSWISGDIAYDAGTKRVLSITGGEAEASSETLDAMAEKVQQFVRINNLILDTDYYKDNTAAN